MNQPVIYAHRGASGYAPENTLPAFQLAIEQGADGIELDVHFTKDRQMVIIHDETIDRTSNGHGFVQDMTLEELRQYNFNHGMEAFGKVTIPTLEEVFALIKPSPLDINIEIKNGILPYPGLEEAILALARSYDMVDRLLFSSFNHESIFRMKQLCPSRPAALLYGEVLFKPANYARSIGADGMHPCYLSTWPGQFEQIHNAGLFCNVWTVDDPDHIRQMVELGVDGIITDVPDVARRVCRACCMED